MIPLLLYAPPLIEVGALDIKSVAGVTMTQVLVAATAGVLAHRRDRTGNRDLALAGGPPRGPRPPPRGPVSPGARPGRAPRRLPPLGARGPVFMLLPAEP